MPGKRGERLWLGIHVTAEAAARAHDAAMIALYGRTPAARLNFPDSAWLLAVPSSLSDLADVRRAAIGAIVDFLRRQETGAVATAEVTSVDGVASAASAPGNASSSAGAAHSQLPCANAEFEVPDAVPRHVRAPHVRRNGLGHVLRGPRAGAAPGAAAAGVQRGELGARRRCGAMEPLMTPDLLPKLSWLR